MSKIHCIHCNCLNDDNEIKCYNCHKTLYELDKYYTDMLKDHLTGKIKDSVTSFILQLIKENLYGIIMTITIVSTVAVNIAIRNDNPKVINEKQIPNSVVINNSNGFQSDTSLDALKILGEAVYTDNYDLLEKSSYLYNFDNVSSNDITKIIKYGISLEDIKKKYDDKYIYVQITDYSDSHYGLTEDLNDINNNALTILSDESHYGTDKIVIPNIEDIASYELEVFVYKQEPYIYDNLLTFNHMTVFYVKINGKWYYLYSSTAPARVIGKRSAAITYRDGEFIQLIS